MRSLVMKPIIAGITGKGGAQPAPLVWLTDWRNPGVVIVSVPEQVAWPAG